MDKNKKPFIPPLKAKHRNNSNTNASLMDKKQGAENLLTRKPNPRKAMANVSSSLIINVVSNSHDTIKDVAGSTAGKMTDTPAIDEHEGFFLRDESQKAVDVYEFHSSPELLTKNGTNKRSLKDCPKHEQSGKRSTKKRKNPSVRQGILKDIQRMQKAMALLREREQSLMTSSEQ